MIKKILHLAFPTIFSRIAGVLLEIMSVFIIGQQGLNTLSAYGLTMPIYMTFYMLSISYLLIFSVKAGRILEDKMHLSRYLFASIVFACILSFVLSGIFYVIPSLLPLFGQSIIISKNAGQFFYYITLGMPGLLISIILSQLLVVLGHSIFVSISAILQLIIGVVSIYLFVHYRHLDLKGAAIGFDIAYWSKCIISLIYLIIVRGSRVTFTIGKLNEFINNIRFLFKLGWPISIQYGSELLSGSIATLMIGHLYTHALAGQQVATQLRIFFIMLPYGISQANSILISRYKKDSLVHYNIYIKNTLKSSLVLGLFLMFSVLIMTYYYSTWYIHIFIKDHSSKIVDLTQIFIWIVGIALILDTVKYVFMGVLRGLQNTTGSLISSLLGYWIFGIPCAYLLGYFFQIGPVGIRLGMLLGSAVTVLMVVVFYFNFVKRINEGTISNANEKRISHMDS